MKEQRKFGSFRSSFSWLLKMAGRDGKASSRKLTLFMASIVLGIAAVVGIQSFGENLKDNIASQSKSLMGADFTIDSEDPPNERVQQIIDSLGGADAREIRFASMAAFSRNDATKLVQVRGIEGDFPFYGELETNPSSAANDFRTRDAALVDATAMAQLGVQIGDSIKIGAVKLPVAGELISVPGSSSLFSSMAPPVIIPYKYIDESGLVQKGSRIDYEFYFRSSPGTDMEELEEKLDPVLDQNDADLDTHSSTSERLGRRYENFAKFLNLVAFIALLLGCVGIASAIHIYIKGKLKAVALLKCLGATRKQTFLIYLIQIAVMGFLGGLMGTLLGLLLQRSFPVVLGDLLPFQVELSFSWQPVFMGLLLGVIISVLFALYPLMGTLYVSPLETLRVREKGTGRSKRSAIWVSLAIFLFIYLFSFWLLNDWLYAAGFVGGMMLTFAILAGVASLFMNLIRKYFPASWGFVPRQSLRNLFRPQNQTLTLVLTIGVGAFLISTLYFTRDLLLAQASIEGDADSPNLILLDVQTEQRDKVVATIRQQGFPVINTIPIVTMRVQNLKGIPVNELRKDTTSEVNTWILNHEFRVTYRDSLIASETLQEGQWVPEYKEQEIIPISVSDGFAQSAMVGVGDTVDFNVQGVVMPTVVKSIRKVDWARMQLNFSLVFPAGVLENAPQFKVLTTRVPDERSSAHLQRELVRQFPNVSIIDLRQVLTVIGDILDKISLLINFMAFFSIFTGVIVLLGAVRTSKYQRIRESVLLRTIGARSRQILKITALEYLYLGALGSLSGILLSLIASQLLAWLLFDASFLPSIIPFLIIFPAITLLVLAVGLGNSLGIIKSPPLEVLRKESR
ncbi:FtsX-like permease family protein [Salinimicrobium catena]|uniref:ABC transporter permease n=1 Tax=Salinimicrobium catena TaxID=390640 RepID=UPI002FE4A909